MFLAKFLLCDCRSCFIERNTIFLARCLNIEHFFVGQYSKVYYYCFNWTKYFITSYSCFSLSTHAKIFLVRTQPKPTRQLFLTITKPKSILMKTISPDRFTCDVPNMQLMIQAMSYKSKTHRFHRFVFRALKK